MFARLQEYLLPWAFAMAIHPNESFTKKEKLAQAEFMKILPTIRRKTRGPVVVAMVGLVGSGKSFIAQELAEGIGAVVLKGDAIRVELRKAEERYEGQSRIAENAAVEILRQGNNVVIDSDHIDAKKRASLRAKVKKHGLLFFVRTHADYDIMAGRTITADYLNRPEDFFGGASTPWNGNEQSRGAVVKLREMWRRTPHHYRWENKGGGRWILRKLPFRVFATIYTGNAGGWKQDVRNVVARINRSTH